MSTSPTEIKKCPACGFALPEGQKTCPNCKNTVLEVQSAEQIVTSDNVKIEQYELIKINPVSGEVKATTTTLPPEVMGLPREERAEEATKLIIAGDKDLEGLEQSIRTILSPVITGEQQITAAPLSNFLVVFKDCQFHGNTLIGQHLDIQTIEQANEIRRTVDLEALRAELEKIVDSRLKKGDYKAVEEIGGALDSLKKDDTPGMLSRIKKAASWLYEETKEIQARVLMFVIEKYVLNKL